MIAFKRLVLIHVSEAEWPLFSIILSSQFDIFFANKKADFGGHIKSYLPWIITIGIFNIGVWVFNRHQLEPIFAKVNFGTQNKNWTNPLNQEIIAVKDPPNL